MVVSNKDNKNLKLLSLGILLVVIIIFLIVFYLSLRVPGDAGGLNVPCFALTGYVCKNPSLNVTTGNLTVFITQNTGTNWTNVYFALSPPGRGVNINGSLFNIPNSTYFTSLNSNITVKVVLKAIKPNLPKGTIGGGFIYAKYIIKVNSSNKTTDSEIAVVKVTSN